MSTETISLPYKCPDCKAERRSVKIDRSVGDDVIGLRHSFHCGSWIAKSSSGYQTSHQSPDCRVTEAVQARAIAEVEFANYLAGCRKDREGLIGTIRQLQYEAKQAGERFDEQLARAAAIYDEAKAEWAKERAEIIGDVRNAEANAKKWNLAATPLRAPYVYDLAFETIDLLRSEGAGLVMALCDGFHVTVANNDEGDALRVTVHPANREAVPTSDFANEYTLARALGVVPTDRRDFPAAKAAALDALRRVGSQSPGSAQAQTRREPMTTKETIAKVIGILQMITMLTPIEFDNTALEFVVWASEKPWFVALVERILPASTADELEAQSLTFEPELVTGLLEFSKETGRPVSGRAGKLLALITQVIAIAKAVKPLFGT